MAANQGAPVRGRAEIDIEAPPQVVWDVLTRFENWPNWNPDVKSMSFPGPLAPGTEFRWKAGPGTIVSTLDRIEPPRYISWRGRTLTISAYHEWWLEPRNGGTARANGRVVLRPARASSAPVAAEDARQVIRGRARAPEG